jgi:K+-sensing histidine kinase KdpD
VPVLNIRAFQYLNMTREQQLEEALQKSTDLNRALLGMMIHGLAPSLTAIKGVSIFLHDQENLSIEERKALLTALMAKIDHMKALVLDSIEATTQEVGFGAN